MVLLTYNWQLEMNNGTHEYSYFLPPLLSEIRLNHCTNRIFHFLFTLDYTLGDYCE
jgi:hypothetical protein